MSNTPSLASTLGQIQQRSGPYIYSILFIFGGTGCCLDILLFLRRPFRKVTCCIYFVVVSIAMLIQLTLGVGTSLYALNPANRPLTTIEFGKVRNYFLQFVSMVLRWCLVAACFDRYALSSENIRLRNFSSIQTVRRVIPVVVLVWLVLPVDQLFYNVTNPNFNNALYVTVILYYHSVLTITTGCVFPALIMLTCAFLIHRNLVRKRIRRQVIVAQQITTANVTVMNERRRDRQVLIILSVQVIVFLITNTPYMLFFFYNAATLNITDKSPDRMAIERFVAFLAEPVLYLFSALSFYLYTLTSSLFRRELVVMMQSILRCRWTTFAHRVQPTVNTLEMRTAAEHQIRFAGGSSIGQQTINVAQQPIDLP